jgi:hypothetical protein
MRAMPENEEPPAKLVGCLFGEVLKRLEGARNVNGVDKGELQFS